MSSAGELMTRPLTVTRPCVTISSASRREARPARDSTLAIRSPAFFGFGCFVTARTAPRNPDHGHDRRRGHRRRGASRRSCSHPRFHGADGRRSGLRCADARASRSGPPERSRGRLNFGTVTAASTSSPSPSRRGRSNFGRSSRGRSNLGRSELGPLAERTIAGRDDRRASARNADDHRRHTCRGSSRFCQGLSSLRSRPPKSLRGPLLKSLRGRRSPRGPASRFCHGFESLRSPRSRGGHRSRGRSLRSPRSRSRSGAPRENFRSPSNLRSGRSPRGA